MAAGDPATQEWRQTLGESTSAALRRVEQERDEAIAAQARIGDRLTETAVRLAAYRQDRDKLQRDLAASQADLTRAKQDHAEAVEKDAELAKELTELSLRLDRAEKDHRCAWRALAETARADRDRMRAQLAEASGEILDDQADEDRPS